MYNLNSTKKNMYRMPIGGNVYAGRIEEGNPILFFDAEATASIIYPIAISENDCPYQPPALQAGPSSFLKDRNGRTEIGNVVALIHHSGSIDGHHVRACFGAESVEVDFGATLDADDVGLTAFCGKACLIIVLEEGIEARSID